MIARDAAESRQPARIDEVLSQVGAQRIGTSKTKVVVAQCIRPYNTGDKFVVRSLYRIVGKSKIREPYVVVSASKRLITKGETAIMTAERGADSTNEDSGWPVYINPMPSGPMFGDDTADFRDMFSHKAALKKIGVTHVIPCEGLENERGGLFGIKKPRRRR